MLAWENINQTALLSLAYLQIEGVCCFIYRAPTQLIGIVCLGDMCLLAAMPPHRHSFVTDQSARNLPPCLSQRRVQMIWIHSRAVSPPIPGPSRPQQCDPSSSR